MKQIIYSPTFAYPNTAFIVDKDNNYFNEIPLEGSTIAEGLAMAANDYGIEKISIIGENEYSNGIKQLVCNKLQVNYDNKNIEVEITE